MRQRFARIVLESRRVATDSTFFDPPSGSLGGSVGRGALVTGGSQVVKASELSGSSNVLFRRNSTTGAVEAVPWKGQGIELNADLHAN